MKKSRTYYAMLFSIVGLIILLGLSLYLGISGWYFSNSFTQQGDLILGTTVELSAKNNQASSASFSFSGGYLKNEKLSQIINVKNDSTEGKSLLRAKVLVFMSDNTVANMGLVTNEHWALNEDGYYYYDEEVIAQSKVNLASYVVLGEQQLCGEKKYIMTVIVEALDSTLDYKTIWKVDPLQNV